MTEPGSNTLKGILNQSEPWAQALKVVRSQGEQISCLWNAHPQIQVIFTGCGSTYYLSLAAAALFQELTGRSARAVPGGELVLYAGSAYEANTPVLLVAISRSGTTTETVTAAQKFKNEGRGTVVVISNYDKTPLAETGDLTFIIPAGQEQSVAQTRSFSSMYVAATAFAVKAAGRDDMLERMRGLPELGEKILRNYTALAQTIGENPDIDRFYFLRSGPRYGLACETNLKMKEMTLTHSEPFHFLEFRHGPMSMVTDTAMVIGLLSDINRAHEKAVLNEIHALGGQILSLGESDADITLESGLPEAIRNVLYLPPLQLMAFYRSLSKGLNPDRPKNLTAVVQLNMA